METRKSKLDPKVSRTLKCMLIGVGVYYFFLCIMSIAFLIIYYSNNNIEKNLIVARILKDELCVLIGFIYCVVAIYSMAVSITKAVDSNDANFAKRHMIISSMFRLAAFCIILIIILKSDTFGIVGGLLFAISSLGIKVGTYLVPFIEKRVQ